LAQTRLGSFFRADRYGIIAFGDLKDVNKKMESTILTSRNFNAYFGDHQVLKGINLDIPKKKIMAMMGPSGCGKTTYLRCINRMHELNPTAKSSGEMMLDGEDVFAMNSMMLRQRIGMVFQRPNPFPNMSIYENVIAGYLLCGIKKTRTEKHEIVEDSLQKAALWDEVKDNLHKKGGFLSGGQQQRLCIARAIAMKPEMILLDEPTSALDPISTSKIEELIFELKNNYTIIIVTHNMQQAARISDTTAFFYIGELIEVGKTREMFTNPQKKQTEDYITGRFG
jgi:phosphate transport system ATP-binding protein